jgi:hypothetical protein
MLAALAYHDRDVEEELGVFEVSAGTPRLLKGTGARPGLLAATATGRGWKRSKVAMCPAR